MTLHWWMHWFWITAQIVVTLTSPTSERPENRTAETPMASTTMTPTTRPEPPTTAETLQLSHRVAKALPEPESLRLLLATDSPGDLPSSAAPTTKAPRSTPSPAENGSSPVAENATDARTTQPGRIPGKKETKITWLQAFSKSPRPKLDNKTTPLTSSTARTSPARPEEDEDALTVMPLREERPSSQDPKAIRRDQPIPANRSLVVASREEIVEPHIVATAASILDAGLGDSTRLGRARGTFTSKFQREQLSRDEQQQQQKRGKPDEEAGRKAKPESGANVAEIATITGSCLAIVVLLSTVGSLGFIMYRRRYLNPPQTLNSDKCSNPDSSGYIDDSTIRDNSEEMYSLDNDSFLNSLEAMTIQNYWTDSVKHTKL